MAVPIHPAAAAITIAFAVACAPVTTRVTADASRLDSSPVMTAERLRKLTGLTAFDALRTMPSYFSRMNQAPTPRFTLVLDGARVSGFELLDTIQATDVLEIRIVSPYRSALGFDGPEVVVTTIAGRKPRP